MRKIKIGCLYRHFKGHIYEVIALAKNSDDLSKLVVYKNCENNDYWVRSYDEFISVVDKNKYPNVTQKYRFEEVSNDRTKNI